MYILTGKKRYDNDNNEIGGTYRLISKGHPVVMILGDSNYLDFGVQNVQYDNANDAIEAFHKILAVANKEGLANISDLEYPKRKAPAKKAEPKQDPKVAQEEEAKE